MKETIEFQPFIPELAPSLRLPVETLTPHVDLASCFEEFTDNLANATGQELPININTYLKEFLIVKLSSHDNSLLPLGLTWLVERLPVSFPNYYDIEVNDHQCEEDKRFTLAHEMGHIFIIENNHFVNSSLTDDIISFNEEEKSDRFARALLAPKSLLLPELMRLRKYDPVALIVILYGKTQMPPYMITERLVNDLHLLHENFLVFSLGDDPKRRGLWVTSQNSNLNDYKNSDKKPLHYVMPNHYKFVTPPRNATDLEPFALGDDVHVITKSDQNEGWFNVHNAKLKGISVGKEIDGIVIPEYGIISFKFGEKIAEVKEIENLNNFIISGSLKFV